MKGKEIIDLCESIAREAHKNQFRWDGKTSYITHPEEVSKQFHEYKEICVAWLHDVIEDTEITREDLLERGVPSEIVDAVDLLTKQKGQSYLDYILKLKDSNNLLAINVKLADMNHNKKTSNKNGKIKYELSDFILTSGICTFVGDCNMMI